MISAASDEQLRALIEAAAAELESRKDAPASPQSRQTVEERPAPAGCYRLELVRCGKCSRCEKGPVHGPYWYWYGRIRGRARSRYIGKQLRPVDDVGGGGGGEDLTQ